jgi:hypothetical protein
METEIQKITKSIRKKVLQDWGELFPELKLYSLKETMLLKRIGPLLLVVVIRFRPSQGEYEPFIIIQNLLHKDKDDPQFGSRVLDCSNNDFVHMIPLCQDYNQPVHNTGGYKDVADKLRKKLSLPFEGDISLDMFLGRCNEELQRIGHIPDCYINNNRILVVAWAGKIDLARKLIDDFTEIWTKGSERMQKSYCRYLSFNKVEEWREITLKRCENPRELNRYLQQQIIHDELESIPYQPLIVDGKPFNGFE